MEGVAHRNEHIYLSAFFNLMGSWLVKILIAEYSIIALAYVFQGDLGRTLYFVGAIILSIGVLLMK